MTKFSIRAYRKKIIRRADGVHILNDVPPYPFYTDGEYDYYELEK